MILRSKTVSSSLMMGLGNSIFITLKLAMHESLFGRTVFFIVEWIIGSLTAAGIIKLRDNIKRRRASSRRTKS